MYPCRWDPPGAPPWLCPSLSLLCRTSLVRPGTSTHQSSHGVWPRRRQLVHWLGHTGGQGGVATSLPWGAYSPEVLISLAQGRPSLDNCWVNGWMDRQIDCARHVLRACPAEKCHHEQTGSVTSGAHGAAGKPGLRTESQEPPGHLVHLLGW